MNHGGIAVTDLIARQSESGELEFLGGGSWGQWGIHGGIQGVLASHFSLS